jgi:hypothetical protein
VDILARVYELKRRRDVLLTGRIPESSRFFLEEEAAPHLAAAFANRLTDRTASEYHWSVADFYVSFVEDGQHLVAAMVEDARTLCLAS